MTGAGVRNPVTCPADNNPQVTLGRQIDRGGPPDKRARGIVPRGILLRLLGATRPAAGATLRRKRIVMVFHDGNGNGDSDSEPDTSSEPSEGGWDAPETTEDISDGWDNPEVTSDNPQVCD